MAGRHSDERNEGLSDGLLPGPQIALLPVRPILHVLSGEGRGVGDGHLLTPLPVLASSDGGLHISPFGLLVA